MPNLANFTDRVKAGNSPILLKQQQISITLKANEKTIGTKVLKFFLLGTYFLIIISHYHLPHHQKIKLLLKRLAAY